MARRNSLVVAILAGTLALGACAEEEEPAIDPIDPAVEPGFDPIDQSAAPVTPTVGIAGLDRNADQRIAEDEFGGFLGERGVYERWNADNDVGLGVDEFGRNTFALWDADRDNRLTEAEWTEGVGAFAPTGFDQGAFGEWDEDTSGFLETEELEQGFEESGLFGAWDENRNQLVEEDEFGGGLFGAFDENEDEFLDENEWNEGFGRWGAGLGIA